MKSRIFKLLIVSSSAIVLIILIFFTNSISELRRMFVNAKLYWIAVAFGCMVMYWIFDALILHTICDGLSERQPMKATIRFTMIGQFFNAITPFSGAGQPVQAYVMAKDGVKPGHAASIIIVKTLLHQVIIVLYSLISYVFAGILFSDKISHFFYLFILGIAINMAFLLFYALFLYNKQAARKVLELVFRLLGRLRVVKNMEEIRSKVERELNSFSEGAAAIKSDAGFIVKLIAFQIIQFTFYFSIPWFIHLAVEHNWASPWEMISAQALITLISLLVPSPGGTGGVEGLSYLFYGLFFTQAYIIPVILIYRLLTYYASVLFGGIFAFFAPEKPLKRRGPDDDAVRGT